MLQLVELIFRNHREEFQASQLLEGTLEGWRPMKSVFAESQLLGQFLACSIPVIYQKVRAQEILFAQR